jgi:hypothetical protein
MGLSAARLAQHGNSHRISHARPCLNGNGQKTCQNREFPLPSRAAIRSSIEQLSRNGTVLGLFALIRLADQSPAASLGA